MRASMSLSQVLRADPALSHSRHSTPVPTGRPENPIYPCKSST